MSKQQSLKPCKCLLKIYSGRNGYYVECIWCGKKSKQYKDYGKVLALKQSGRIK